MPQLHLYEWFHLDYFQHLVQLVLVLLLSGMLLIVLNLKAGNFSPYSPESTIENV